MTITIHTPTNNLENSLKFYQDLDFKVLTGSEGTFVSDGKAIIEINPDRYARAGIKLTDRDWTDVVTGLQKLVHVNKINNGYVFADPSGSWIYLMETPTVKTLDVSWVNESFLGNYVGLSLESTNMALSLAVYETLGFAKTSGSPEQGWIGLQDRNGFGVNIMKPLACPHLFFNPSLTYFNGEKNVDVIKKIREINIPITEEITHFNKEGIVDNVILRDPGGFGFFIFSD